MAKLVTGIFCTHMLISPEPLISPEHWIVEVTLSLDPCVSKNRETGYPTLGPVQIFPRFQLRSTQSRDFSRWDWRQVKLEV